MFGSLWRSAWNRAYKGTPTWDLNRVDPVFLRLLDDQDVSGPGRAIDMGCGTGDLALELARRGFSVVGVDWSATAIAKAKQKAEREGVVVDFRVDDVTTLEVAAGGGFDLIVDRLLFCQLAGRRTKRRYAATLKRLTKPGGHVLLFELMLPGSTPFLSKEWFATRLSLFVLVPGDVERYFGDGFSADVIYRTQTSDAAETQPQRDHRRNVEDRVEDVGVWLTRNP